MANDIEEVKRGSDIVDVISSYVTLKKAGKDYKALCPFHKEKTPSFFVSPEKQIFKCFGCGEGGDVYDFIIKQEGLEFGDALKILADRAGVQLTPRTRIDREAPGLKNRLYAINRLSALFFHKIFLEHPTGKSARDYLSSRGVKPETIKQFWIGFAPAQGPLTTFLARKGFSSEEIEKAGRPDRFNRRIIFPIFDVVGNVVGFSGRVIDPNQEPKYLNTPETDIFHKGRILYGLFQAKKAIKDSDQVIVVEGQMDVVMSHQSGNKNVVATSGTALTGDHLHFLFRYTPNLALAFDTDPAGERAADLATLAGIKQGFTVKLIPLTGKDPADLVKTNPALWYQAIGSAKEAMSFVIDREMSKFTHPTAEHKKSIAKNILPYLAALPDPIEQETWVHALSHRLAVSEKSIYLALSKLKAPVEIVPAKEETAGRRVLLTPAETLLGLILAYPSKAENIVKRLDASDLGSDRLSAIYEIVKKEYRKLVETAGRTREVLGNLLTPDQTKTVDNLLFSVTHDFPDESDVSSAMEQLVNRLTNRRSEELKREYSAKIARAEASGDRGAVKELIGEFQALIAKQ